MKINGLKRRLLALFFLPLLVFISMRVFPVVGTLEDLRVIKNYGTVDHKPKKEHLESALVLLQNLRISGASVADVVGLSNQLSELKAVPTDRRPETLKGIAQGIVGVTEQMQNQIWNEFAMLGAFVVVMSVFFIFMTRSLLAPISNLAASMKLILDHTAQGFFHFDQKGKIGGGYSRAAEHIFGRSLQNVNVATVLPGGKERWSKFVTDLFDEPMPFEDLVGLLPAEVNDGGRVSKFEYKGVRDPAGKLSEVMVVATDITEIRELEKQAETERELHKSLIRIISAKSNFLEVMKQVDDLQASAQDLSRFKILLHSLKGSFSFFHCRPFVELCHQWESRLSDSSDVVEALAAARDIQNEFQHFLSQHEDVLHLKSFTEKTVSVSYELLERVQSFIKQVNPDTPLARLVDEMQEREISEALSWLDEVWTETATALGKEVEPIKWVPSVKINPNRYEKMFKTLIHVVRNSVDHGIESPEVREALGKPRKGRLAIELKYDQSMYCLTLTDDGAGIDLQRVIEKAKEKGLPLPQSDDDVTALLLSPEFSTKSDVTEVSGRGVGLSALKQEVQDLQGRIRIRNLARGGTRTTIWFIRETEQQGITTEEAA